MMREHGNVSSNKQAELKMQSGLSLPLRPVIPIHNSMIPLRLD